MTSMEGVNSDTLDGVVGQAPIGSSQQTDGNPGNMGGNVPPVSPLIMPWVFSMPWVPKFAGEQQKFKEWQTQTRAMLRAQPLNGQQQADFVLSTLDGNARREATLLQDADRVDGEGVIKALEKIFGDTASNAQRRVEFYKCRQNGDETTSSFALRLRECHARWRAADREAGRDGDSLLRDQFVLGLRAGPVRQELQRLLRRDKDLTFQEAQKEARALEKELDGGATEAHVQVVRSRVVTPPAKSERRVDLEELRESLRAELRNELTVQLKTLSSQIVEELRDQQFQSVPATTLNATSRMLHTPPTGQNGRPGPSARPYQWDAQGRPICLDCGEAGHVQRYCPNRRQRQGF